MNRTRSLFLASSLVLAACGGTVSTDDGGNHITKKEARELKGIDADGGDICASEGWYGDGACDDFCVEEDLDCSVSSCPNGDDPHVHYLSTDDAVCAAAFFACPSEQVEFNVPECGCGCIDQQNPGAVCGGFAYKECQPGFFCNFDESTQCGSGDLPGTCAPIPDACPEYYGPVCGCDGVTYSNPCFANGAGTSVIHDGACEGDPGAVCGGFPGTQCQTGEFCNYALEDICGGGDQSGNCQTIPDACDTLLDPVCGCDNLTYSNECFANAAGTAIASKGECVSTQ